MPETLIDFIRHKYTTLASRLQSFGFFEERWMGEVEREREREQEKRRERDRQREREGVCVCV